MQIEERRYLQSQVRLDAAAGSKKKAISGYAAKFGVLSSDLGGFKERLQAGCFRDSLAGSANHRLLLNHDASKILSRRSNGLTLWEDSYGLRFRAELANTSAGRDAYELCASNHLNECSFGFRCLDEDWSEEDDDSEDRSRKVKRRIAVRTVKVADLFEVSMVAFPAYPSTSAGVDSMAAAAGSRSLFPQGLPYEVRSRFPNLVDAAPDGDDETTLRARAARFLARLVIEEPR